MTSGPLPAAMLSLPAPGETALGGLRKRVVVLAAKALLTRDGPDVPAGLARVQWALARVSKKDPDAVLAAVAGVDALAPTLAMMSSARAADECVRIAMPHVLMGVRSELGEHVTWEQPCALVIDRARGDVVQFDPPARVLDIGPRMALAELETGERVVIDDPRAVRHGVERRHALHVLRADLPSVAFAEIDSNPLALDEAHPEKSGNAIDLGGRDVAEWVRALGEALELVRVALPSWYAELPVALERIVPVGWNDERHFSASYREAPGLVYMTLHPDPLTMAEAIVHEVQHGKLNLLTWADAVLDNAYTTWTESPVRPDLRPVMGVLLAVHAFIPVAALHRELARAGHPIAATPQFAKRRAEVLAGNTRGLAVVQSKGEPTPTGKRVIDDLARLHALLASEVTASPTQDDALPG